MFVHFAIEFIFCFPFDHLSLFVLTADYLSAYPVASPCAFDRSLNKQIKDKKEQIDRLSEDLTKDAEKKVQLERRIEVRVCGQPPRPRSEDMSAVVALIR